MRSVWEESGAFRGVERSRRPFAEDPTRLGLRRRLLGEATWLSARQPREVRRAHDDGHAIAPRVERDVFALQQELVDEHGEAEEIAEGRHGAGHAARQLEQLGRGSEAEGPHAEDAAQPSIVDAQVAGKHAVDGAILGADDQGLGAGLGGRAAHAGRLFAGAHGSVLEEAEGHALRAQPGLDPVGDRGATCLAAQRPVKRGARFSRKCATPSLKSAAPKLLTISSLATAVASLRVWNCASQSWRLITAIERGETRSASSRA